MTSNTCNVAMTVHFHASNNMRSIFTCSSIAPEKQSQIMHSTSACSVAPDKQSYIMYIVVTHAATSNGHMYHTFLQRSCWQTMLMTIASV